MKTKLPPLNMEQIREDLRYWLRAERAFTEFKESIDRAVEEWPLRQPPNWGDEFERYAFLFRLWMHLEKLTKKSSKKLNVRKLQEKIDAGAGGKPVKKRGGRRGVRS
jgi:hypothetical protein